MRKLNSRSAVVNREGVLRRAGRGQTAGLALFGRVTAVLAIMASLSMTEACADTHTAGVPQLNSLPGAPYTLYLDFAGFNFTGTWGGSGTPGNTPAFDNISGTFSTAERNKISQVWARVAQCYTPFHVNVTTIDPAALAGQADTDAHRQAYYDVTPQLMHTVIGQQQNSWFGPYGGVSYVGVAQDSYDPSGYNGGAGAGWKTNWIFTDGVGTGLACGQAAAHENGHGLSLLHQSDYTGDTYVNEYSVGDNNSGNGTYAPIMGAAYYTQRGAWRVGDSNNGSSNHIQNDVSVLLGNNNIGGFVEDGIGHSLATATLMPLSGSTINAALAKGIITPASTAAPTPIGASNYTTDFFRFYTSGGPISLVARDGSEFLTVGAADPGATLRSTLKILDPSGTIVGSATEAASTLSETYSGTLSAGWYYAQIASYGGHSQTLGSYNTTSYFDMGSYFLTGSGFSLPGPSTWKGPGGGSFNLASNWANNSVPTGVDATANFSGNITTPSTVTLDSSVTVGTINFDSSTSYTVAGASSLVLQTSSGNASVNVLSGSHNIAASVSVAMASPTVFQVNNSTDSLTVAGNVSGGNPLTKNGLGTLILQGSNSYTAATTVSGGLLLAAKPASLPGYSSSGSISVASGAAVGGYVATSGYWTEANFASLLTHANWTAGAALAIDTTQGSYTYASAINDGGAAGTVSIGLTKLGANTLILTAPNTHTGPTTVKKGTVQLNGPDARNPVLTVGGADIQHGWSKMVFDYSGAGDSSPATTVAGLLSTSYNGGAWNTGQFRSSTAVAEGTTLGWIDNTTAAPIVAGPNTFAPNTLTVMATLPGDVNLDGKIDFTDLGYIVGNYGMGGPVWTDGDINYDHIIDFTDLGYVIGNYGSALPAEINIAGSHIDAAGLATLGGHGITAIPEPGTIALLAAALIGLLPCAWRRRKAV
jgi:autotransporter-associated beta strand protein